MDVESVRKQLEECEMPPLANSDIELIKLKPKKKNSTPNKCSKCGKTKVTLIKHRDCKGFTCRKCIMKEAFKKWGELSE